MNNKKSVIIFTVALIVLIGGVGVGYNYLTKEYVNDDKVIEEPTQEEYDKYIKSKERVIKEAADFSVYDVDGNVVKLSHYKGVKPVVVNFWASWCPPCKEEMPYFQEANNKYNSDDVEILMVNLTDGMRETKEKALNFMNENNYKMKTLFDSEMNAAEAYYISAVPRTLFIDKYGMIIYDHTGAITQEQLDYNIDKLIEK